MNDAVLVVNNKAQDMHILRDCLQDYTLYFAKSSEKAMQILTDCQIDLIIISDQLTEQSLVETILNFKENHKTNPIPVLCILEPENLSLQSHLLSAGMTDFIIKPLIDQQIRLRVEQQFYQKQKLNLSYQYAIELLSSALLSEPNTNRISRIAKLCQLLAQHYGLESAKDFQLAYPLFATKDYWKNLSAQQSNCYYSDFIQLSELLIQHQTQSQIQSIELNIVNLSEYLDKLITSQTALNKESIIALLTNISNKLAVNLSALLSQQKENIADFYLAEFQKESR